MKNYLLIFSFLLFELSDLYAQLQKGDWIMEVTMGASVDLDDIRSVEVAQNSNTFIPRLGVMISNRSMFGLGLNIGSVSNSDVLWNSTTSQYEFSPFYRYYFNNRKKNLPFVEVETSLTRKTLEIERLSISDDALDAKISLGLGMDFFIAPNIAVEGLVAATLFERRKSYDLYPTREQILSFQFGIKTFLNKRFKEPFNVRSKYLKKGNYRIGGNAQFKLDKSSDDDLVLQTGYPQQQVGDYIGFNAKIAPSLTYFKADNWTIRGGANLTFNTKENGHNFSLGGHLSTAYYYALLKQLYLKPEVGIGYTREVANEEIILRTPSGTDDGSYTIDSFRINYRKNILDIPLSLSLVYFSKENLILSAGVDLQQRRIAINNIKVLKKKPFIGFEYFFSPNLSATGKLIYEANRHPIDQDYRLDQRFFKALFGLNYFIFNPS